MVGWDVLRPLLKSRTEDCQVRLLVVSEQKLVELNPKPLQYGVAGVGRVVVRLVRYGFLCRLQCGPIQVFRLKNCTICRVDENLPGLIEVYTVCAVFNVGCVD